MNFKTVLAYVMAIFNILTPLTMNIFGDKSMRSKEKTAYTSDETGSKIINIPYEDYLSCDAIPENAVTVNGICETNSGEENAAAIQAVIDEVSQNGGGVIAIAEGTYKTSTIRLKDNITLHIPYGSELQSLTYEENMVASRRLEVAVIVANNCRNIAVTGGGAINGMGLTYTTDAKNPNPIYAMKKFNTYLRVIESRKRGRIVIDGAWRRNVINFSNCTDVTIENLWIKDSAAWTVVFNSCNDVHIKNLVIDDYMHVPNSDGIDVCGGNNISIEHCFIASGDDSIVLKPIDSAISNLTVKDCKISSYANCFKIGTETKCDVTDVTVSDCCFFIPDGMTQGYSGIAVESCDGANIKNVNISNIEMNGVSAVFLVWLGNRFKYGGDTVGSIDGVTISNITAENIEMPSAITGCIDKNGKKHYVQNVKVENVNAVYRDTGENLNIRNNVGEYTMGGYPDITRASHIYFINHKLSQYWDLPCYGLLVKHAENVGFESMNVTPRTCNKRPFSYMRDVK